MNREIKFRAWDARNKHMLFSSIIWGENSLHMPGISYDNWSASDHADEISALMQFTGLNDKDGFELFEGDIVRYDNKHVAEIVWERGGFVFKFVDGVEHPSPNFWHEPTDQPITEVIGNIYETPHLVPSTVDKPNGAF